MADTNAYPCGSPLTRHPCLATAPPVAVAVPPPCGVHQAVTWPSFISIFGLLVNHQFYFKDVELLFKSFYCHVALLILFVEPKAGSELAPALPCHNSLLLHSHRIPSWAFPIPEQRK